MSIDSAIFRAHVLRTGFYATANMTIVIEALDSRCKTIKTYGPWSFSGAMTIKGVFEDNAAGWPSECLFAKIRITAGAGNLHVNTGASEDNASVFSTNGTPSANTPTFYVLGDTFVVGEYPVQ